MILGWRWAFNKQMSIERQQEPKDSFMGVSTEPSVNKKKFHLQDYVLWT